MHADRLGDHPQRERAKVGDAVPEKPVLLLDDLGRHLDDGAGALVQRLHQPIGVGQTFGQPRLGRLVLRAARQLGVVSAVDQQLGKRGAVELDRPSARAAADEHVWHDAVDPVRRAFEPAAGLGIVSAQLADHVGQILVVDRADALERGEIALGEIVEIGDQPRHRRIVAVGVARLQGQAFG